MHVRYLCAHCRLIQLLHWGNLNLQHFWIFLLSWSVFQRGTFPSSTCEMRALLQVFSLLSDGKQLGFSQSTRWLPIIIFAAKNVIAPKIPTSDLSFPVCATVSGISCCCLWEWAPVTFLWRTSSDTGTLCWHVQSCNAWEFILTLPAYGSPWPMILRMGVWKPSSPGSEWAALKLSLALGFCGALPEISHLFRFLPPSLSPLKPYYITCLHLMDFSGNSI